MLTFKKGNKVYHVAETDTASINAYLNDGFDEYKDGKLIKTSFGKTITYEEHLKVIAEKNKEIEVLKAKLKKETKGE